ncbi:MAG TPA: hypothetical protein VGG89_08055 [Candidatus Baltobacteraceae bacterium]
MIAGTSEHALHFRSIEGELGFGEYVGFLRQSEPCETQLDGHPRAADDRSRVRRHGQQVAQQLLAAVDLREALAILEDDDTRERRAPRAASRLDPGVVSSVVLR